MYMLPTIGNAFRGEEHQTMKWRNHHGKAALLIHGFPGTPAEMTPLAMHLHELGWTVHAPLLPGFGQNIHELGNYSYKQWLDVLADHLRELQIHHNQILIIGYSMGGALAMQLAAEHKVKGLVLFCPFWQMQHFIWHLVPVFKRLFPSVKPFKLFRLSLEDPELRKNIQDWIPELDLADAHTQKQITEMTIPLNIFDQIRIAGKRAYALANKIYNPTLVFQGTRDDVVPTNLTRRILGKLSGTVHYIEVDAAHDIIDPCATHWLFTTNLLSEFVNAISEADS